MQKVKVLGIGDSKVKIQIDEDVRIISRDALDRFIAEKKVVIDGMIQCKCINKHKNKYGVIVSYDISDGRGHIRNIEKDKLKLLISLTIPLTFYIIIK